MPVEVRPARDRNGLPDMPGTLPSERCMDLDSYTCGVDGHNGSWAALWPPLREVVQPDGLARMEVCVKGFPRVIGLV